MYSMQLRKVSNGLVAASLLGIAAVLLAPTPAHAAFPTANLPVNAQVNANCTISTAPVNFGAYDPVVANAGVGNPLNGNGSVTIACTKGSAPSITLDLGAHAVGAQRNMLNQTVGSDVLAYQLYQPPNNTAGTACTFPAANVWGTTVAQTFTPTAPPSKAARTYNVCGTVPGAQDVNVGTYQDIVVATVNF